VEAVDRYGQGYVETNELIHNGSSSLSMTGKYLEYCAKKTERQHNKFC
jgi:hypothetical protein